MEEEFEPKRKIDEEKEEIKNEVKEEKIEEVSETKDSDKKGMVGRIISRIIWIIIFIVVAFEVVMGILNMQRINDDKEPIWCFSNETKKENNKTETTCNLGLYVIVKTKEGGETRTTLKPFFIK